VSSSDVNSSQLVSASVTDTDADSNIQLNGVVTVNGHEDRSFRSGAVLTNSFIISGLSAKCYT